MNLIKNTLYFLLSLLSIVVFYYLLSFLFIFFERISDFWIILITIVGGGLIGFITVGYSQILNKLIPANKYLNGIFILFCLGLGLLNVLLHWQINVRLVPRICFILVFAGVCLMIIKSRLVLSEE